MARTSPPFSRLAALDTPVATFRDWWIKMQCPPPCIDARCRSPRYLPLSRLHAARSYRIADLVPRLVCQHCRLSPQTVDLISQSDALVTDPPAEVSIRLVGYGVREPH
jgi:hypothetical protein